MSLTIHFVPYMILYPSLKRIILIRKLNPFIKGKQFVLIPYINISFWLGPINRNIYFISYVAIKTRCFLVFSRTPRPQTLRLLSKPVMSFNICLSQPSKNSPSLPYSLEPVGTMDVPISFLIDALLFMLVSVAPFFWLGQIESYFVVNLYLSPLIVMAADKNSTHFHLWMAFWLTSCAYVIQNQLTVICIWIYLMEWVIMQLNICSQSSSSCFACLM